LSTTTRSPHIGSIDTPGITRRPIRQINGESEFAEVFFEDVLVPSSALLGPLHQGWNVTIATLGFERAGVISIAGKVVDDVMAMVHSPGVATAGPVLRQRVVEIYTHARILQWMGNSALANINDPAAASTASSLIKHSWALLSKSYAEVDADLAGHRRSPERRRTPPAVEPRVEHRWWHHRGDEEHPRRT